MSVLYLDRQADLADFCASLRGVSWIALDTEFIREKTYYAQLSLIQVATDAVIACIDPLALDNLSPLLAILADPAVTKVAHAAYQDLEIFYHLSGAAPTPVFDTQLAATVLGYGEQIGYAALVKAILGVELDKSQTRTDWSLRPLSADQLAYAADDVRYLRDIYHKQCAELTRLKRLDWLTEDFQALSNSHRYAFEPEQLWRRIRGVQQLRGAQLAVLQALAAWRERQAISANRPRRWIAGDELLLELARQRPRSLEQLERLRSVDSGWLRRYGRVVLQLVEQAGDRPEADWPRLPLQRRLTPAQEALLDAMQAVVRLRGAEHAVSPQLLASRQELEQLLLGDPDAPLLHGWRAALAGRDVQALLRGEARLEVRAGALSLTPTD